MLGLGETEEEIFQTINDLYEAGCKILTLGSIFNQGSDIWKLSNIYHLKSLKNTGL